MDGDAAPHEGPEPADVLDADAGGEGSQTCVVQRARRPRDSLLWPPPRDRRRPPEPAASHAAALPMRM